MPLVSVIMPCFNHTRFVAESIQAILRQSFTDVELLVVDDCSTDSSWQVVQGLAKEDSRIRPLRHDLNLGASRSRNDGLLAARGRFVGFCDADDVWLPHKLAEQLRALECNPQYDVAYCDARIVDETGQPVGKLFSESFPLPQPASGYLFGDLVLRNFINMQSVLMRRECLLEAAGFDERIKWVEDWWYWVRVSHSHRFLYSPEPLAHYRVHRASTNLVQQRGYAVNRYKVFRRILRRYPDLPLAIAAEVYYKMGFELYALGRRRSAARLMWRSATLAPGGRGALKRALKAFLRIAAPVLPRRATIQQPARAVVAGLPAGELQARSK